MVAPLIPIALGLAAEFLPGLVKHLAGDKAGEVAEKVVSTAQAITGTGSAGDAAIALRANPELAIKFKTDMANLEVELEKVYLQDRQDARKRDVAIRQAGQHNYRADVMLFMAFVAFIAIITLAWLGRHDMPDMVFAFLNMAGGALLKMIGDAFQFEFGSSRGSREKDALLNGK